MLRRRGAVWQLTCYSSQLETPEWPTGGFCIRFFPIVLPPQGLPKEEVPDDHAAAFRLGRTAGMASG